MTCNFSSSLICPTPSMVPACYICPTPPHNRRKQRPPNFGRSFWKNLKDHPHRWDIFAWPIHECTRMLCNIHCFWNQVSIRLVSKEFTNLPTNMWKSFLLVGRLLYWFEFSENISNTNSHFLVLTIGALGRFEYFGQLFGRWIAYFP